MDDVNIMLQVRLKQVVRHTLSQAYIDPLVILNSKNSMKILKIWSIKKML